MADRAARYGRSVFATALFVALIVAGWGFVSLLTNTDVMADHSVGPVVVPVAVAIAAVAMFFALAAPRWSSVAGRGVGALTGSSIVLALGCTAAYLAALGILQFVSTGRITALILVIAAQAATAYTLVVIGAAFITSVGLGLLGGSAGRAAWPWEK
ncbi:hypothetical protein [Agreia sp. COWG]|uniref:hypothetical protein n=1 Tax=Agreia sp. COWG TaxID=2773266 RepID=UPI001925D961|nr:hypothetical protein [Agreia sp. COWG]CAD6004708.1 conserved membrane protein of unknown function [Agreia sp. COWG]